MGTKRFATNPLLYIHQPTITTPEVPMQFNYYTPKQQDADKKNPIITQKSTLERSRSSTKILDIKEESLEENKEEEPPNQNKFKDMTIIQKVNYFIDRPDYAPQMRCEIKTKERKYQGIITGFENDHVLIRVGRRSSSSEIPLTDILDIRMIGF